MKRFIPACAGNGLLLFSIAKTRSVHPRVCGEWGVRIFFCPSLIGSSPRVRGMEGIGCRERRRARFIPACAGNGTIANNMLVLISVHPRVCGEWRSRYRRGSRPGGSSPRVRGMVSALMDCAAMGRFIPACAGNGDPVTGVLTVVPVHPRVCGEWLTSMIARASAYGSSPRVRGMVRDFFDRSQAFRFIPACAGNGCVVLMRNTSAPVHPRVCGEWLSCQYVTLLSDGSSPRVRGMVLPNPLRIFHYRFIPACAGNGQLLRCGHPESAVHPRVCGEWSKL